MDKFIMYNNYRRPKVNCPPAVLKVLLIGDTNVGKISLTKRFGENVESGSITRTIGVEILHKNFKNKNSHEEYKLQFWTSSKKTWDFRFPRCYMGADICVLSFAINDRISYTKLKLWRNSFLQRLNTEEAATLLFVVVGNKTNIPRSERKVSRQEAETWCSFSNIPYFEISAKDDTTIEAILEAATTNWEQQVRLIDMYEKNIVVPFL